MSVVQVNVYEAKTQLSKLIESALSGDEVVIARAGKPVVRLVRWEAAQQRTPGSLRGRIEIGDEFEDFTAQDEADWYGESP